MSLSENIKRIRLENGLTQEQLAGRLGISAQAVSKWETSETYPDGSLLLPLAQELNVSLDELFGNDKVSMTDISRRIIKLFGETPVEKRMHLARDIGWQMEKGLFNGEIMSAEKYSSEDLLERTNSSYILNDYGFTLVSNGKEPFFAVFPEPEEGYGHFLEEKQALYKMCVALSSTDTLNAMLYLMKQKENFLFEPAFLAKECNIADDKMEQVMADLTFLGMLWTKEIVLNDSVQTVCHSCSGHKFIALCLIAREILQNGGYCVQSHYRNKPLLKADSDR